MIAAKPLSQAECEVQVQRDWDKWQAEHRARCKAKGYSKPVSDEEAADILGLLG